MSDFNIQINDIPDIALQRLWTLQIPNDAGSVKGKIKNFTYFDRSGGKIDMIVHASEDLTAQELASIVSDVEGLVNVKTDADIRRDEIDGLKSKPNKSLEDRITIIEKTLGIS